MDAARFPDQIEGGPYVAYLQEKYAGRAIDLVIAQSGPASLLLAKRPHLFAGVPRLFVNPARLAAEGLPGELEGTVITAKADIHAAFDHMLAVVAPKRVIVIGETVTPVVRHNVAAIRKNHPFPEGTTVDYLLDLPLGQILAEFPSLGLDIQPYRGYIDFAKDQLSQSERTECHEHYRGFRTLSQPRKLYNVP